jgi:lipoprotein-anchoring transpeptidase ErfK/SrfK
VIQDKQHWPKWHPPPEMQGARDLPEVVPGFRRKYPNGMDGSPKNPLGSRALYLWANNKDTLYRIHATNDWTSIGNSVSSGCIRMWNQDVMDLYDRVGLGTKVVVLQGRATRRSSRWSPRRAVATAPGAAPAPVGTVAYAAPAPQ